MALTTTFWELLANMMEDPAASVFTSDRVQPILTRVIREIASRDGCFVEEKSGTLTANTHIQVPPVGWKGHIVSIEDLVLGTAPDLWKPRVDSRDRNKSKLDVTATRPRWTWVESRYQFGVYPKPDSAYPFTLRAIIIPEEFVAQTIPVETEIPVVFAAIRLLKSSEGSPDFLKAMNDLEGMFQTTTEMAQVASDEPDEGDYEDPEDGGW